MPNITTHQYLAHIQSLEEHYGLDPEQGKNKFGEEISKLADRKWLIIGKDGYVKGVSLFRYGWEKLKGLFGKSDVLSDRSNPHAVALLLLKSIEYGIEHHWITPEFQQKIKVIAANAGISETNIELLLDEKQPSKTTFSTAIKAYQKEHKRLKNDRFIQKVVHILKTPPKVVQNILKTPPMEKSISLPKESTDIYFEKILGYSFDFEQVKRTDEGVIDLWVNSYLTTLSDPNVSSEKLHAFLKEQMKFSAKGNRAYLLNIGEEWLTKLTQESQDDLKPHYAEKLDIIKKARTQEPQTVPPHFNKELEKSSLLYEGLVDAKRYYHYFEEMMGKPFDPSKETSLEEEILDEWVMDYLILLNEDDPMRLEVWLEEGFKQISSLNQKALLQVGRHLLTQSLDRMPEGEGRLALKEKRLLILNEQEKLDFFPLFEEIINFNKELEKDSPFIKEKIRKRENEGKIPLTHKIWMGVFASLLFMQPISQAGMAQMATERAFAPPKNPELKAPIPSQTPELKAPIPERESLPFNESTPFSTPSNQTETLPFSPTQTERAPSPESISEPQESFIPPSTPPTIPIFTDSSSHTVTGPIKIVGLLGVLGTVAFLAKKVVDKVSQFFKSPPSSNEEELIFRNQNELQEQFGVTNIGTNIKPLEEEIKKKYALKLNPQEINKEKIDEIRESNNKIQWIEVEGAINNRMIPIQTFEKAIELSIPLQQFIMACTAEWNTSDEKKISIAPQLLLDSEYFIATFKKWDITKFNIINFPISIIELVNTFFMQGAEVIDEDNVIDIIDYANYYQSPTLLEAANNFFINKINQVTWDIDEYLDLHVYLQNMNLPPALLLTPAILLIEEKISAWLNQGFLSEEMEGNSRLELLKQKGLSLSMYRGHPNVTIDWFKKVFQEFPNLKKVDLSSCYYNDDLGDSLSKLKELQELKLQNCPNITDSIGKYIKDLKNLKYLNLSECSLITGKIGQHLKLLPLEEFHLFRCTGLVDIDSLGGCLTQLVPTLKVLNLGYCPQLNDKIGPFLASLKNLETLILSREDNDRNSYKKIGSHISSLTNLKKLDLHNAKELKNLEGCLKNLINLEDLDVTNSFNLFDSVDLTKSFENLKKMRHLNCNNIDEFKFLIELKNLHSLRIKETNKIEYITSLQESLHQLEHLEILEVSGLYDEKWSFTLSFPNLKELTLRQCLIKQVIFETPTLEKLFIKRCQFTYEEGMMISTENEMMLNFDNLPHLKQLEFNRTNRYIGKFHPSIKKLIINDKEKSIENQVVEF